MFDLGTKVVMTVLKLPRRSIEIKVLSLDLMIKITGLPPATLNSDSIRSATPEDFLVMPRRAFRYLKSDGRKPTLSFAPL